MRASPQWAAGMSRIESNLLRLIGCDMFRYCCCRSVAHRSPINWWRQLNLYIICVRMCALELGLNYRNDSRTRPTFDRRRRLHYRWYCFMQFSGASTA